MISHVHKQIIINFDVVQEIKTVIVLYFSADYGTQFTLTNYDLHQRKCQA